MILKNKYDSYSIGVTIIFVGFRFFLIATKQPFHWIYFAIAMMAALTMWSIKHNFIHLNFFNNKILNSTFGKIYSIYTCTPLDNTRLTHIVNHHTTNNTKEDWTCIHDTPHFRSELIKVIVYPFMMIPRLIKGKKAFIHETNNFKLKHKIRQDNTIIITVMILCLIYAPLSSIFYIIIPVIFGQWFLLVSNYLQHKDTDNTTAVDHSINYTGWIYNILYFNVGFHSAHHNFPYAHWSELPRIHKEDIAPKIQPCLIKTNYLKSLLFDYGLKINPATNK